MPCSLGIGVSFSAPAPHDTPMRPTRRSPTRARSGEGRSGATAQQPPIANPTKRTTRRSSSRPDRRCYFFREKRVKIDDGPEGLVLSQGGTNGSNPTCSSGESRELPYRDAHRSQGPSTRQSRPTPDCRAATNPNPQSPLRDSHAAAIMPMPRRRIPILIVAVFPSRSPRYSRSDSGRFPSASCCCSPALSLIGLRGERGSRSFSQAKEPRPNCSVGTCSSY